MSNTFYNHRIVKEGDQYRVCQIFYDENQKPFRYKPVELTSDNIEEISSLLIYSVGALTEPVIDATIFEDSVSTALDFLRGKGEL